MGNFSKKVIGSDIVQVLVHAPYLLFSLAVVFSQIAFNMTNVVLFFLVYYLTSSNLLVSIILILSLLPQVILSFLGGIVADLKSKKQIILYGNILRAGVLFSLFFGYKSLTWIYIVAFVTSVITQFYTPAEAPLIPKLVHKKHLVAANSIFGLTLFGSILLGFLLAGPTVDLFGRANVFLVISALFSLSALFVFFIGDELFASNATVHNYKLETAVVRNTFTSYLSESYKLIRTTKEVSSAFTLLTLSQVIIMVIAVMVPGYAKTVIDVHAESASYVLFAPAAIGMIVAAVAIGSVFKKSNRLRLMNIGLILSGIALIFFPLMSPSVIGTVIPGLSRIYLIALLALLAGIGNALIFVPAQTTIQERIPEAFRSKIYGLLFALIGAFSLIPIFIVGTLADVIGVGRVLFFVGLPVFVGGIIQLLKILRPKK